MGCNPDILENICPSGLRPSGLYFPIYPDYNPCIISIFHRKTVLYFWTLSLISDYPQGGTIQYYGDGKKAQSSSIERMT